MLGGHMGRMGRFLGGYRRNREYGQQGKSESLGAEHGLSYASGTELGLNGGFTAETAFPA